MQNTDPDPFPRPPDLFLKFDMHVHSLYSSDSMNSVHTIVRSWKKSGILPLVCDHDSIRGSVEVYRAIRKERPDIPLILAEEIMTRDGEIIGAFLTEEIPPGLSAEETIDEIRSQGAISIVPHPFCSYRDSRITGPALGRITERVDCIEGYNARMLRGGDNHMAVAYAKSNSKPVSVGSDAHTPFELGRNYLLLPPFRTPGELLRHLPAGDIVFRITNSNVRYISRAIRAFKTRGYGIATNPVPGS
jgi:predicted metal-dependent phosphoesterase TrpH